MWDLNLGQMELSPAFEYMVLHVGKRGCFHAQITCIIAK